MYIHSHSTQDHTHFLQISKTTIETIAVTRTAWSTPTATPTARPTVSTSTEYTYKQL